MGERLRVLPFAGAILQELELNEYMWKAGRTTVSTRPRTGIWKQPDPSFSRETRYQALRHSSPFAEASMV